MKRGFKSDCEKKSIALRKKLGLKKYDPIDPLDIAKESGIIVLSAKEMIKYGMSVSDISSFNGDEKYSFSAVTLSTIDGKIIIYNHFHSTKRTKTNLTHEIAHQICKHDFSRLSNSNDGMFMREFPSDDEEEADWLTGALLIPREGLLWAGRRGMNIEQIANHFETTIEIARWRYHQTGVAKQLSYSFRYR